MPAQRPARRGCLVPTHMQPVAHPWRVRGPHIPRPVPGAPTQAGCCHRRPGALHDRADDKSGQGGGARHCARGPAGASQTPWRWGACLAAGGPCPSVLTSGRWTSSRPKQRLHPERRRMLGESGEQLLFGTSIGAGGGDGAGWCDEPEKTVRFSAQLPCRLQERRWRVTWVRVCGHGSRFEVWPQVGGPLAHPQETGGTRVPSLDELLEHPGPRHRPGLGNIWRCVGRNRTCVGERSCVSAHRRAWRRV